MPETPFEHFLGQRRTACTELLLQNEDVSAFFAGLLDHLVDYARAEGISFREITLDRPFVTNDGRIVAQIRKGRAAPTRHP